MQRRSLVDRLAEIGQRDPLPRIDVGLSDRNRISLDHWTVDQDCVVGYGPAGGSRYLIPIGQIVIVEVTGES
jgi:hypothetical protein